ncbi:MAG: hypothetical protein ACD_19C00428G0007 [uncultured bacterium]|nr:MAG: hypothetical protein ACD_19C00428G0007 [uncultured bacterium]
MEQNYGGVIWTNHALSRLNERGIKQSDAWAVWNRPDQSRYSKIQGAWVYYRTWNDTRIEVVAKQNEKKEWIILSVWSKKVQPYKGVSPLTWFVNLFKVKHG